MAEQFRVDLRVQPSVNKPSYALWVLSRVRLASVLMNSLNLYGAWHLAKTTSREPKKGQFHPTAMARKRAPVPVRAFLESLDSRKAPGRVLYHGIGRDEPGLEAMGRDGRDVVVGYDPYHPEPERQIVPSGRFDEVFSIYTLNVVSPSKGIDILGEIYDVLLPGGKAIIAVRKDL